MNSEEILKDSFMLFIESMIKTPRSKTRIGVDGLRVDTPELPPLIVRMREVKFLFFFKKTIYEMSHDRLRVVLSKAEFEFVLNRARLIVQGFKKNEQRQKI